jgi:hypothetical protein
MSQRLATILTCTHYQDKGLRPFSRPEIRTDDLVTTLLDPDIGNFDCVETFVDRPAGEILEHLEGLFKYRKPYDLILVYYAGLGFIDRDGQVFLAAIDTDPKSIANTAIPAAVLNGWMDNSFSRQQNLIFDIQFVTIDKAGKWAVMPETPDPAEAFRGKGYWRLLLNSCSIASSSHEGESALANSTTPSMSDLIIRGLETGDADKNNDGLIGLRDLYSYLKDEMQKWGMSQKPNLYTYLEKDDFVLAKTVTAARRDKRIKWDLLSGAITLPIAILVLGWRANLIISVEASIIFLLFYALLYRYGD